MSPKSKVTTFLWFDSQAEEAAKFYVSLFDNAEITSVARNGDKVQGVSFRLGTQEYIAFNGGPHLKLTPAVSLYVNCKDQAEVDRYWDKLQSGGGQPSQCGWLQDRYGLSWQVIPSVLPELLQSADAALAQRVMQAMLKMSKIEIAQLQAAARG